MWRGCLPLLSSHTLALGVHGWGAGVASGGVRPPPGYQIVALSPVPGPSTSSRQQQKFLSSPQLRTGQEVEQLCRWQALSLLVLWVHRDECRPFCPAPHPSKDISPHWCPGALLWALPPTVAAGKRCLLISLVGVCWAVSCPPCHPTGTKMGRILGVSTIKHLTTRKKELAERTKSQITVSAKAKVII